jgi:hypothetical protein
VILLKSLGKINNKSAYIHLICLSAIASIFFRGVLGLFYPMSLNSLVWDETLIAPIASFLGVSFNQVISLPVTEILSYAGSVFACIMVLVGISTGLSIYNNVYRKLYDCSGPAIIPPNKNFETLLLVSSALIFFVCVLKVVGRGFNPLILVEWACQIGSCLVLICLIRKQSISKSLRLAEICVALTFIGHGLFALGWPYAVPSHFIDMFVSFVGTTESLSRQILLVIGLLDVLVGLSLFFKIRSTAILSWAIVWGGVTALARTATMVMPNSLENNLYWLTESAVRLPHMLLPLAVLVGWKVALKTEKEI